MGFLSDNKPHTAVTTNIDTLCGEEYEEDDLGEVVELIEIINIKPTGATEAARALRKKLKYGSKHKQLRALTLLEALVSNGGSRLDNLYNDDLLLERLRQTAMESYTDNRVKRKIITLATIWSKEYASSRGKERLAMLYKNLPSLGNKNQRRRTVGEYDNNSGEGTSRSPQPHPSRYRALSNPPARVDEDEPRAMRNKNKNKNKSKKSGKNIDMVRERPKLNQTIAEANTSATNLKNALQLVNREFELSTENEQAVKMFEKCKKLRRQILRYIQVVDSEEYIGSLIHANEELIKALKVYEKMSKALGEESDSDWNIESKVRHLNVSDEDDDGDSDSFGSDSSEPEASNPDNPFDDSHVIDHSPVYEKGRPF